MEIETNEQGILESALSSMGILPKKTVVSLPGKKSDDDPAPKIRPVAGNAYAAYTSNGPVIIEALDPAALQLLHAQHANLGSLLSDADDPRTSPAT